MAKTKPVETMESHATPKRLSFWLVALAGVFVGGIIAVTFIIVSRANQTETAVVEPDDTAKRTGEVTNKLSAGDADGAIAQTEAYLQKNPSQVQKVALLEQQAAGYVQKNDLDKALEIYKQAEQASGGTPDIATAQGLVHIYATKGDNEMAIKYAKLLVKRAEASDELVQRSDAAAYRGIIRSLGGTP